MKKKYLSRYTVYALSLTMCVNPVFASKRAELTVNHSLVKKEELLPSLEIRDDALNKEEGVASNIARIGQDISQKGNMHSAIKDLSEGFISDYVSDLLNQNGNARIGLHSEKKQVHYDVDYLYPAYVDRDNQQVLFGQFDAHQYSRHIMNVGIGYRKAFDETAIVGANIFSDYDLNGQNVRIGVGGELMYGGYSLTLNGYRGITDWHQSEITGMDDYDEKPASGYDVRVNALLPYHIDLTGVYEKYYGDMVSLTGGRENIYNSPQNIKVIARYTPVPMFSFSMEQGTKTGFGVAAQLNYHFGVPLKDQLRSDVLYPVYNTTESRLFDFANRNYDIPMQYKKQTVLTVNMPSKITSEYGEEVTITPNIYSKYGVKNILWHTRTVVDEGGTSSTVGRGIHITLPPQKKAGNEEFVVTVEVTDNKLHKERASTIIIATPSNKVLSSQVVKNSAQADGVQKDTIKFIAFNKETKGVLSNKKIHLTGSGVTIVTPDIVTNSLGVAWADILSTHSGSHSIKAELENGFSINTNIQFVPDVNSVTVSSNILKNNALANNKSENEISVLVSDKYGNPVPDLELNIATTNSARALSEKIRTDDTGHALIKIKSTVSGDAVIQIFINDVMYNKININFLADQGTARISSGLMVDNYAQEGTGYDLLKVQVIDALSNPVSAFPVSFSGDSALVFASSIVKTDDKGFASVKIRGKKPGCFEGIGSIPGSEPIHVSVCFSINPDNARISMFKMDTDGQIANGQSSNKFTIKVTDATTGVALERVHVWIDGSDKRLGIKNDSVTNSDGEIKGDVTSSVSGEFQLAARLHNETQKIDAQVMTNFVADISTANVSLDVAKDQILADGVSTALIRAIVTDANGNPLAQKDLLVSGDDSIIILDKNNIKTNNNGNAMIYVSTKSAGRKRVIIKLKENTHISSMANLTFVGDAGTGRIKSVVMPSGPVIADGNDMGVINVNVEDANGNTVSGVDVFVEQADPALVFKSANVRTDLQGHAMFRVSSIRSGNFSFSLSVAGQIAKPCSYAISFVGDKRTLSLGHMEVRKDNALANGSDKNTLRVYLVDKNANPVSDARVRLIKLPTGWVSKEGSSVTNKDGWVDLSLSSNQVIGVGQVVVGYSSDVTDEYEVTSPKLSFLYDVSSVTIHTKIIKDNASTNGVEEDVVEVNVSDKYSIPVSNEQLNVSAKDDVLFPKTLTTDKLGYTRLNISSQRAGYKTLNVSLGDKSTQVVVYFKADVATGSVSKINVIQDNAYIPNKNKIQAVVSDAHGDPVEGAIVKFSYVGRSLTGLTGDYTTDKEGKTPVLSVGVSDPISGAYTVMANIKDHKEKARSENVYFRDPGQFDSLSFKHQNDDVIINADIVRVDSRAPVQDFFRYSVVGLLDRKKGHEYSKTVSVKGGKVEIRFSGICDASHMATPQDQLWLTLKDMHDGFLINSKKLTLSDVCR